MSLQELPAVGQCDLDTPGGMFGGGAARGCRASRTPPRRPAHGGAFVPPRCAADEMPTAERGTTTVEYDLSTTLDLPYEKAVAEVRAALEHQGFGVLT